MTTFSTRNNFLAHSLRGYSSLPGRAWRQGHPQWQKRMRELVTLHPTNQEPQTRQEERCGYKTSRPNTHPHVLQWGSTCWRFYKLSKQHPQLGTKCSKSRAYGTSHIQTHTLRNVKLFFSIQFSISTIHHIYRAKEKINHVNSCDRNIWKNIQYPNKNF